MPDARRRRVQTHRRVQRRRERRPEFAVAPIESPERGLADSPRAVLHQTMVTAVRQRHQMAVAIAQTPKREVAVIQRLKRGRRRIQHIRQLPQQTLLRLAQRMRPRPQRLLHMTTPERQPRLRQKRRHLPLVQRQQLRLKPRERRRQPRQTRPQPTHALPVLRHARVLVRLEARIRLQPVGQTLKRLARLQRLAQRLRRLAQPTRIAAETLRQLRQPTEVGLPLRLLRIDGGQIPRRQHRPRRLLPHAVRLLCHSSLFFCPCLCLPFTV